MKKIEKNLFSKVSSPDGYTILKDGKPISADEVIQLLNIGQRRNQSAFNYAAIVHDMVVAEQSAWIEWQRGNGAEAAMQWIQNGLWPLGRIPDESKPYSNNAQSWFNANIYNHFHVCSCGNPSSINWMNIGACSEECLIKSKSEYNNKN